MISPAHNDQHRFARSTGVGRSYLTRCEQARAGRHGRQNALAVGRPPSRLLPQFTLSLRDTQTTNCRAFAFGRRLGFFSRDGNFLRRYWTFIRAGLSEGIAVLLASEATNHSATDHSLQHRVQSLPSHSRTSVSNANHLGRGAVESVRKVIGELRDE